MLGTSTDDIVALQLAAARNRLVPQPTLGQFVDRRAEELLARASLNSLASSFSLPVGDLQSLSHGGFAAPGGRIAFGVSNQERLLALQLLQADQTSRQLSYQLGQDLASLPGSPNRSERPGATGDKR